MRRLLALLLVALVAPVAADHGAPSWADPAVEMGLFPTHDEVQAHIDSLDDARVTIRTLGESDSGRPIRLLEIAAGDMPREARVVTFIMTQQHGNEPAGTPAALRLLDRIVAGEFDEELSNQLLLLLPMTNPDGATANIRGNASGVDINRDHVALHTVEAQAVHKVLRDYTVHVAVDHHEYSGTGFGEPVPVRTYDWDLTMMHPRHGNVHPDIMELSKQMMYDHIFPAANERGFSTGDYGMVTVHGVPVEQVAGGPDPGILRNNFGLNNVVGLLAESFVNPANPFQDAERRTQIHEVTMEATLAYAHDYAVTLMATKEAVEQDFLANPPQHYVEGDVKSEFYASMASAEDLTELMWMHGLPAPVHGHEAHYYDLANHKPGLAAAILHPASSRAVADATPGSIQVEVSEPYARQSASVPGPALAAVLGVLALAFVLRRS